MHLSASIFVHWSRWPDRTVRFIPPLGSSRIDARLIYSCTVVVVGFVTVEVRYLRCSLGFWCVGCAHVQFLTILWRVEDRSSVVPVIGLANMLTWQLAAALFFGASRQV